MMLFLENINIGNGLFLVYGLIFFIILSIIIVLIVDKVRHQKKDSLFHSKHLSERLKNLQLQESTKNLSSIIEEASVPKTSREELVEKVDTQEASVMSEISEVSEDSVTPTLGKKLSHTEDLLVKPQPIVETSQLSDQLIQNKSISEEHLQELEKTQAQIEVEAITKALEKAVEEEKELNKYAKFEEEQELNAIISYKELKEKFDELYDSNERTQYVNDDTIPINLKELYETNTQILEQPFVETSNPSIKKQVVSVDTQSNPLNPKGKATEFRNSPIISPVYGIQREEISLRKEVDSHLTEVQVQKTTDFLNTLKELQKNLD